MNTLLIRDGDIVLQPDGRPEMIDGPAKIVQDLTHWLLNDLRYNRFHPWAGASLERFVGESSNAVTAAAIKRRVQESLRLYYDNQFQELRRRIALREDPVTAIALAHPDSIVESWDSVSVRLEATDIAVDIGFKTIAGSQGSFAISIESTLGNLLSASPRTALNQLV